MKTASLLKRVALVSLVLVLLGVGFLVVYYFVFLHFIRIPSGSMANTIIPGDYLVVKKRAFGTINRGDLIVFKYSGDPSTYYLARVIGLPGETIQVRGKLVYLNGENLSEQRVTVMPDSAPGLDALEELSTEGAGNYRVFYLPREAGSPFSDDGVYGVNDPFQIPDNQYFVMGDNRDNSADSRYKGSVSRDAIFGKPLMIFWSARRDVSGEERPRWDRVFSNVN